MPPLRITKKKENHKPTTYTPNYQCCSNDLGNYKLRTIDVHVARENWKSFTKIAESFFI